MTRTTRRPHPLWVLWYGVRCAPLRVWLYASEWNVVCRMCAKGIRTRDNKTDHGSQPAALAAACKHWQVAHGYLTARQDQM